MKRTLCAILCAAAVGLCITSCSKAPEEGYATMQSESCDFTFEYPADWTETYKDGMLSVTKLGDVSGANIVGFSFRHGLESTPTSMEYWSVYENQLSETFKNVNVNEVLPVELGGAEQVKAFYTVTIGEEVFEKETLLIVYGDKVYTLTLTQGSWMGEKPEGFEDFSAEFENSIKSFRIK